MSESQTLLLGFIAGVTILIGLPLGRVRSVKRGTRQFLNALAIGILIFLLWDVLVHAFEPVDIALGIAARRETAGSAPSPGRRPVLLGITVGLGSAVALRGLARLAGAGCRLVPGRPGRPRRPCRRVVPEVRAGHDGAGGTGCARTRGISGWSRPAPVPAHRDRHRSAQLRRRAGHRRQRRGRRDRPGHGAGHRVRAAQRDRGVRHRGPAGRRGRPALLGVPPAHGADRRRSHLRGYRGGTAVHQRRDERDLPDPGRRVHPLRRHPAARGGLQERPEGA